MEYTWSKDRVQTSRILFHLRFNPTCVERLPASKFRNTVAPIMFLYMGHPNGKVARASHSLFVAFVSSGKDSNDDKRVLLKEQLVFYYIQRSLEGYAMGSPLLREWLLELLPWFVIFPLEVRLYSTLSSLVEKTHYLCCEVMTEEADLWKNWQEELEPCPTQFDETVSSIDCHIPQRWLEHGS